MMSAEREDTVFLSAAFGSGSSIMPSARVMDTAVKDMSSKSFIR
jgi:hypothetical protein